jgi:hypothetical protein
MSFVITVVTQEGIVMASDSRLTINNVRKVDGKDVFDSAVSQSDTSYKTFLTSGGIGISTFGAASVKGVPLSGYIDEFISEKTTATTPIEELPTLLTTYMKSLPELLDTGFHIAGYRKIEDKKTPFVSRVYSKNEKAINVVPSQQLRGTIWDGESDVMVRVLNPNIFIKTPDEKYDQLASFGIPFDMFTLQDAIDFSVYAVNATIDTMRFQLRYKTVGGPVDVLIIKPDQATWLQKKTLRLK